MTPIPAHAPIGGPLWSLAVPAILFVFTFLATWLLYRHFTGKGDGSQMRDHESGWRD